MTDPTISVEDLSISLGDVPVLSEVSLAVEPGELVGLVGPNGAGKTTLLRSISGVLAPDSGSVRVDGDAVGGLSSRAASRRVAVVPQHAEVSFSFDVREIVAMARHPHRSRFSPAAEDDRRAVDAALERTGVTDLADRPIDEISGGERQRVLLARAVAQETPALLLDEPTASLDVNHQVETLELVRSLVADGTAALAAIHDLDLAARYCDRLALLADGEFVAVGTPEEVLTESAIDAAFDVRSVVARDPATGSTSVTALPDRASPRGVRVHVLGTGGTAANTLVRLDDAGYDLSAGPLPEGDVAAATARSLGVDRVVTTPLSPPDGAELAAARERARGADAAALVGPQDDGVDAVLSEVAAVAPATVRVVPPDAAASESVAVAPDDAPTAVAEVLADAAGTRGDDAAAAEPRRDAADEATPESDD
ncbi:iron complex transport system ATP-binding protein [Natronoarchaeum philippinense]|uniref:Cobalamin import ATP-binding protein BtuD n=1 Tax=Natronoarchaeum philippinense TaxID=558529 RepID=A0A285N720_NATPI|nr:heme ABC transporter ATP-binding protein [Natronoarchaeum philippinense]SNZ05220.1 iron complex transport system ATP-binding protein [Natronoarchaeum philippinense]